MGVLLMTSNVFSCPHVSSISRNLEESFTASPQSDPIILLIGGYQGSGKSSLISRITHTFDANVISNDVIRQQFFDNGYHPDITPEFSNDVNAVCAHLFKMALSLDTHVILDGNAHAKRLASIDKLLHEFSSKHSVVKILLTASPETLRERVRARLPTPGAYQGTECDLNASLQINPINPDDYDLIIDTEHTSEKDTATKVLEYLQRKLEGCDHF